MMICGQLALVLFIEVYIEYHQLQSLQVPTFPEGTTPWIRIATDNQGLIDRIKTGLDSKVIFAGAALAPECDIVHEILLITRRLPIPLVWEHVKGHQDAKKKWYELTWMETLNVRADYHATEGLENARSPPYIIQTIPSSKVALRIDATDITSHYASHLRKAASRPAIIQRVAKHYGWTEAQFDMIDWKAHHGAIQKLRFADRKFVIKFIHQSLPMGAIFHIIDPSQAVTCSSCKMQPESETHLYRCKTRHKAMLDGFLNATLPTFLEDNHTCPELAYTLMEALNCDLDDYSYPQFKNRHGAN
jgi:hypothetical protein